MEKVSIAIAVAAAIGLSGCAGMSRLNSYGFRMADAQVHVGRAGYNIWVHPVDSTIIVQERLSGALGGAVVEGFTFGIAETSPALVIPRHAAAAYLARFDCRVEDAYLLEDITTEIAYSCQGATLPVRIDERPLCTSGSAHSSDWQSPEELTLTAC